MSKYLIRVARMFNGTAWSGPSALYMENGRITKVADINDTDTDTDGPELIDFGPDVCALPGLIDTHVHLAFDASADPVTTLAKVDDDELLEQMRRAASSALFAGITAVRDLGDRSYLAVALGREFDQHPDQGPHIVSAGPPLTPFGGHCHFFGGETEGTEALRTAVRERHEHGCGVVKIMLSGGNMTPGSKPPYASQYTMDDLRTVVEEAHRLGLPVAAHVHGNEAIVEAIEAGVDTLEHVTFLTPEGSDPNDEVLAAIAGNNVFASLTLGTDPNVPFTPPAALAAQIGRILEGHRALHVRGARIVVGTDAGIGPFKPHNVLPHAVAQLLQLGFSSEEALAAVTAHAAEASGLGERKGRLRAGSDADLLVVNGDPARDASALLDVAGVFRAGVRVR
ncbi:amidohydrolase family protein [Streptomyces sp. NPDC058256]|uniref:amidohydrolase family protein n=1 Tax=Streptomyces sp. NPDC058256 TaxID=3346408 RepID=UPI0036E6B8C5